MIQESCIHLSQYIIWSIIRLFSLKILNFSKHFDSEFSYIEVWFTGENFKPLEIEDKMNIALVTKSVKYEK